MDDRNRSFAEQLDYRIAVRLFEFAFEACERLPDQDQHILLEEIAKRGSQKVGPAEEQRAKAIQILGIEIDTSRQRTSQPREPARYDSARLNPKLTSAPVAYAISGPEHRWLAFDHFAIHTCERIPFRLEHKPYFQAVTGEDVPLLPSHGICLQAPHL